MSEQNKEKLDQIKERKGEKQNDIDKREKERNGGNISLAQTNDVPQNWISRF